MERVDTRLTALERKVATAKGARREYSYAQLVEAVTMVRLYGLTRPQAMAKVGPPEHVVAAGELSMLDRLALLIESCTGVVN